jgi:thioredoxin 1
MTDSNPLAAKIVPLFAREIQVLNEHEFYNRLAETLGPCIVFFTKPGCSACRAWKLLLNDLLQHRHDITVYQIDAEQNMALSHEYELFHLPALFLFVNGEFHRELQAEARMPHLLTVLNAALVAPAEDAP